jgi:hypothetical protein
MRLNAFAAHRSSENSTDTLHNLLTPDTWVVTAMLKSVGAFQASTKEYSLIPMGAADPYTYKSSEM